MLQLVSKIPTVKYQYLGSFSLDFLFLPKLTETFQHVNTTNKVNDGDWMMLARLNDSLIFGDSLKASSLTDYPQLN